MVAFTHGLQTEALSLHSFLVVSSFFLCLLVHSNHAHNKGIVLTYILNSSLVFRLCEIFNAVLMPPPHITVITVIKWRIMNIQHRPVASLTPPA